MATKSNKSKWILRIAFLVMLLTVVTWSLLSGTFAKFTEKVNGNDSVQVADFSYSVEDSKGSALGKNESTKISIFECIDEGIFNSDGVKVIAPGSSGSFGINVKNTSDVLIEADFAFNLIDTSSTGIPVYFTYKNLHYANFYTEENATDAISGITLSGNLTNLADVLSADAEKIALGGIFNSEIIWTWAFESNGTVQNNENDTALGNLGTDSLKLEISTIISQLNG